MVLKGALRISPPVPIRSRELRNSGFISLGRSSTIACAYSEVSSASPYGTLLQVEKHREPNYASGGTWIELFYDLFFAASLSAFSRTREISGQKDLIDLAAFFSRSNYKPEQGDC